MRYQSREHRSGIGSILRADTVLARVHYSLEYDIATDGTRHLVHGWFATLNGERIPLDRQPVTLVLTSGATLEVRPYREDASRPRRLYAVYPADQEQA